MSEESKIAVFAAMGGNLAVAILKFMAALVTGSSAMWSEAVHSVVDTGDSLLLYMGLRLSQRPPDRTHPMGYGKELYFWSTVVSMMIFGAGGCVTIYEGVLRVLHPEPSTNLFWNYAVLGGAALFEGTSLAIGYRQFRKSRPGEPFWQAFRRSKDPTTFTVVFEDSAALLGLLVAFLGIFLANTFGMPVLDGVASIVIGTILACVALLLGRESRGLLIGEAADPELLECITKAASRSGDIDQVSDPLTMYFGPENVMLALSVHFRRELSADEVAAAVDRMEAEIRRQAPQVKRIFVEAEALDPDGKLQRVR
jgi:cation diffusion facilitator family transporter